MIHTKEQVDSMLEDGLIHGKRKLEALISWSVEIQKTLFGPCFSPEAFARLTELQDYIVEKIKLLKKEK